MHRPMRQVDVFTEQAYHGNPVAVVHDSSGLSDDAMQRFAHWTNLSETAYLLPPTNPAADYRVRIFQPTSELPFAGHPTLGTCHAWLEAGGTPRDPERIVQECEAGLVEVRRTRAGLAFAAPPLLRSGPVEPAMIDRVAASLRIPVSGVVDAEWVDNGPGWVAVLLESAEAVLALRPGLVDLDIGAVGPYPPGASEAIEVRGFFPKDVMGRGSGHGQPQRVARWLAHAHRPPRHLVRGQPGDGTRPPGSRPRRARGRRRDLDRRRDRDLRRRDGGPVT